ncbi:MAG: dipeptidase PepV, partial [Bacilli bacterium]|nr:dipeptidase PepV [Bacilli bacterium]
EYGNSEDYIAVLAHLDVVPAGGGWTYPAFGAEIHEGKIYARGAIDDKGPGMAVFFALRMIKELDLPLNKRVRLIYGCHEENPVWHCMNYYFAHEPKPICGFTPDADFPLIYAEKGILSITLIYDRGEAAQQPQRKVKILSLKGGERENMVPDFAEAVLQPAADLSLQQLKEALQQASERLQIAYSSSEEAAGFRISVQGVSAHGSLPHLGVNAVVRLCQLLSDLAEVDEPWLKLLSAVDPNGESLGIACRDDVTGELTANLGVVSVLESAVDVLFNIRYPVDQTAEQISANLQQKLAGSGWKQTHFVDNPPLYVPTDSLIVKTLSRVYQEETGDTHELLTIGGGTYARAIPNAVAFGPLFPGQQELAHQKDEFFAVNDLLRVSAIYAKAIYELSNAEWPN